MFRLLFMTVTAAIGVAFVFSSCTSTATTRTSDSKSVKHYYGPHQTGTNL